MRKKLTPKQRVLKLYPTAFYAHMGTVPHHRIWFTVNLGCYLADRFLGKGLSPAAAWADALRRVDREAAK